MRLTSIFLPILGMCFLTGCALWERTETGKIEEVERKQGTEGGQPVDLVIRRETVHNQTSSSTSPALMAAVSVASDAAGGTPWGAISGGVMAAVGVAGAWMKSREAKQHKDDADEGWAKYESAQERAEKYARALPPEKTSPH